MGWSGGVLKGSCAAFGEEGRGLEEEPRNPIASSWILTPITDLGNRKGCEEREVEVVVEGGGWRRRRRDIDFGGCFYSGHTLCPKM